MQRLRTLAFCLLFVQVLFSCKEDEKPDGRVPVTIEGFTISSAANPAGRISTTLNWEHTFGEEINLTFVSRTNQQSFSVRFQPDFSGELPQILLPPDSYSYSGSTGQSSVSSFLPVYLEGNMQVKEPSTSLLLSGKTNYQLVSISGENLKNTPQLLSPVEISMFSHDGFYYAYVKANELVKSELTLENGKKLRWGLNARIYGHDSFFFRTSSEGDQVPTISDPVLDFAQATITLDEESVPDYMGLFNQIEHSSLVKEASGLQWVQGRLFAINDGGNPAEFYELSPDHGGVVRTIRVANAQNIDWEDLALGDNYLYIGDFGNNLGNRSDLRVLRIPIADALGKTEVQAEVIAFGYDRQTGTGPASDHRFDCEAMVFHEGKLLLFTKPSNAQGSDVYTLDPNPGMQTAKFAGTFETKGWITGADLTPGGKNIVFIGYENAGFASRSILSFVKNPQLPSLAGNILKSMHLGSVALTSQTEGIAIDGNFRVKIAGEQIRQGAFTIPQLLSELDLKGILED